MRVGLDIEVSRSEETRQTRLVERRRELSRYVIGAVAVCCLILVASLVRRESHAPVVATEAPRATAARTQAVASPSRPVAPRVALPAPPPPDPPMAAAPSPMTEESSSGVIRFARPAKPGAVWIDGKRTTGTSVIVPCGTHQARVGWLAKHSVTVPCGGEVVLTR